MPMIGWWIGPTCQLRCESSHINLHRLIKEEEVQFKPGSIMRLLAVLLGHCHCLICLLICPYTRFD